MELPITVVAVILPVVAGVVTNEASVGLPSLRPSRSRAVAATSTGVVRVGDPVGIGHQRDRLPGRVPLQVEVDERHQRDRSPDARCVHRLGEFDPEARHRGSGR